MTLEFYLVNLVHQRGRQSVLPTTQLEDIQLCESWENISLDPVTGNEQPSKAYWKQIHDNFHANRKFESDRNANSLEHRWATIHKECQNRNICLKLKMHMQAKIQRRRGFLSFIVG